MKKSLKLWGLLSILLIAGMMFTACSTDDGGSDDGGTSPGSLPSLPIDDDPTLAYVASEAEAKALLTALKPAFGSVGDQVQSLIENA
jgi:hypothetical protein